MWNDMPQHKKGTTMTALIRRSVRPFALGALLLLAFAVVAPAASAGWHDGIVWPGNGAVLEEVAPDLVVTSLQHGWSMRGGHYTQVVVMNQGNTAAGDFYVSNSGNNQWVAGLNAGASVSMRFYRGSNCETGSTVVADSFNQVYELNEGNNQWSWSIVC